VSLSLLELARVLDETSVVVVVSEVTVLEETTVVVELSEAEVEVLDSTVLEDSTAVPLYGNCML